MNKRLLYYCPYCKKNVSTSNGADFEGVEYNETPIRRCSECFNVFYDMKLREASIKYYKNEEKLTRSDIAFFIYFTLCLIPCILLIVFKAYTGLIFFIPVLLLILLLYVPKKIRRSTRVIRNNLSQRTDLPLDVELSLRRMDNPKYVALLQEALQKVHTEDIPDFFFERLKEHT